jgi:cation transport protein ChaC
MADRSHPQYAGRLSLDQQLHLVRQGRGHSGINRDYVIETVASLEAIGYAGTDLHRLAARLKGGHDSSAATPSG